jgi:hypothetical protein
MMVQNFETVIPCAELFINAIKKACFMSSPKKILVCVIQGP